MSILSPYSKRTSGLLPLKKSSLPDNSSIEKYSNICLPPLDISHHTPIVNILYIHYMMKKLWWISILLSALYFLLSTFVPASAQTPNFSDVLEWMHSIGLTKYDQVDQFRPFDSITRWEAAKFVAEYAELQSLPKNYTQCDFSDIAGYDSTLTPHIKQACFYGLMKWSNGRYRPNWLITEAEAITVVMRSVYGFFEETADPRYIAYYNRWVDLGLITNESLRWVGTTNISREKLGTWLYQVANQDTESDFYTSKSWQAHYVSYNEGDLNSDVDSGKQVALFFHAPRCPLCHGIRENILEGIEDLPNDVRIYEVNIDTRQDLMRQYGVEWKQTFVFLDNDGEVTEVNNRLHTIDHLLERFE